MLRGWTVPRWVTSETHPGSSRIVLYAQSNLLGMLIFIKDSAIITGLHGGPSLHNGFVASVSPAEFFEKNGPVAVLLIGTLERAINNFVIEISSSEKFAGLMRGKWV